MPYGSQRQDLLLRLSYPEIGLERDTEELRGDLHWCLQGLQKCLRRKLLCARLTGVLSVQDFVATMSTTSMIYILQGLEWSEP